MKWRRRVINGLIVLTILISVAFTSVWIRSDFAHDTLFYYREQDALFTTPDLFRKSGYEIHSYSGRLVILSYTEALEPQIFYSPPTPSFPAGQQIPVGPYTAIQWQPAPHPFYGCNSDQTFDRTYRGGGRGGAGIEFMSSEKVFLDVRIGWLLIAFAVLLIVILRIRRREKRSTISGTCTICGYDLRATPKRCPECGTVAISA
jgi:hypothetical protein